MNTKIANLVLGCLIALSACKSSNLNRDTAFWGELEENQNYLFQAANLAAIADGELNSGSIVLFGEIQGDFQQVYLTKYKKNRKVKYYLYKPKYKRLGAYAANFSQNLVRANIDYSRTYQTGERGGCYYVNSNGNRIYVDKSFCSTVSSSTKPSKSYKSSSSKTSGSDTYVKGHYRTTKSGKTIYVKPHTRSKH